MEDENKPEGGVETPETEVQTPETEVQTPDETVQEGKSLLEQLNTPENLELARQMGSGSFDLATMTKEQKLVAYQFMNEVLGTVDKGAVGAAEQAKATAEALATAQKAKSDALEAAAHADDLLSDPTLDQYLQRMRAEADKALKDADVSIPTPEVIEAIAAKKAAELLEGFRKQLEAPRKARIDAHKAAEAERTVAAERAAVQELLRRPEFEEDGFFDRFEALFKEMGPRGVPREYVFDVARAHHAAAAAEAAKIPARRSVRPGSGVLTLVPEFDTKEEEYAFFAANPKLAKEQADEIRRAERMIRR